MATLPIALALSLIPAVASIVNTSISSRNQSSGGPSAQSLVRGIRKEKKKKSKWTKLPKSRWPVAYPPPKRSSGPIHGSIGPIPGIPSATPSGKFVGKITRLV